MVGMRRPSDAPGRITPGAGTTHYDVLGVGESADALQIRAAYVRLLKDCHPDSAPVRAADQSFEVERLVTAYKTLKDVRLRALYDAQLNGGAGMTGPRFARPALRTSRRSRGNEVRMTVAISLLVVALSAIALFMPRSWKVADNSIRPRNSLVAQNRDDMPSPSSLEPIAHLAAGLSLDDATAFSKRCFAKAVKSDAPSAADQCIAFDTAFTYWQQGVGGTYLGEPYFQPQAEAARTENALARLDSDAAMVRASSIRASTFEALLKLVGSNADLAPPLPEEPSNIAREAGQNAPGDSSARGADAPSRIDTSAQ